MQVISLANQTFIMSNIVDVVAADKYLVALGTGMKAAGLNEMLSQQGPYTVFAPSELAFGKLPTGEWPELLKPENRSQLTDMMNHYIVKGTIHFKDLTDGEKLTTLSGKELNVSVHNGDADVQGARIQGRDMDASNGVVHSLDRLIR
jgi:uncharacterized surface protein with fasciclin (FAS1) repeats